MSDTTHVNCGCNEYNELSRRNFIARSAGAAVFGALMPEWMPKVVLAKSAASSRDVIVHIFQRGGADGLSLVTPYADQKYYDARPNIAIPRPGQANGGKDLNGTFMLPPAMAGGTGLTGGMWPAYQAGELLIVHGTGLSYSSRSHFDAQHFIEVGKANDLSLSTGWLGRHLATTDAAVPGTILRGLSMSSGLPDALKGAPQTLPIPDPRNFGLSGSTTTRDARTAWLATDYYLDKDPGRDSALDATATLALLRSINVSGYVPSNGATYPANSFGTSLKSAAALIKADVGVEAIQIDVGGWDTHSTQTPILVGGQLYNLMRDFSNAS